MHRLTRFFATAVVTVALAFSFAACSGEASPDAQEKEDTSRQSNYERLVEAQPALGMDYSPTRDTKNFWIKTWGQKGKNSYVYLLSNGDPWAFAVIKRLPVNYCTSLVVPYQIKDYRNPNGGNAFAVPGPSIDGTFSSSANCTTMYGEDATTGAYVEWTVGADTTMLLRDQPLPLNMYANALPLGDTNATEAQKVE